MNPERRKFIAAAGEGIRTAYEILGLTVPQIAEQQEMQEGEVQSVLWEISSLYRKEHAGQMQSEDDFMQLYENLARNSTVDAVRERALRNIINERKGRNDIPLELLKLKKRAQAVDEVDTMSRILQFNEEISRVRESLNATNPPDPAPTLELK